MISNIPANPSHSVILHYAMVQQLHAGAEVCPKLKFTVLLRERGGKKKKNHTSESTNEKKPSKFVLIHLDPVNLYAV